jgi:hypothetical protein
MTASSGARTRYLVICAAAAGVLVATAVIVGAPGGTDVDTEDTAASSVGSSSEPTAAGTPVTSDDDTSTDPDEPIEEPGSAPVTVDMPRSERVPTPGVRPDSSGPSSATPPTTPLSPITDPEAAARAYLVAAETVTANDAGRRHDRAAPYMAPGNPALTTGLLVSDPPSAGHSRTIEVVAIDEHARNGDLDRIAFRITYQRHLSPTIPASTALPDGALRITYVVVERQVAGDWLVLSQSHELDPVE